MPEPRYVEIHKHGPAIAPMLKPAPWAQYNVGEPPPLGYSLPNGYFLRGFLLSEDPPEVGKRIVIARTERNGMKMPGQFASSFVRKIAVAKDGISDFQIETENSIYRFKYVAPPINPQAA